MFSSDIFMGHRGQPPEQATFADCGYFENPASTEFAAAPSPVVAAPPLLINSQLAQVESFCQLLVLLPKKVSALKESNSSCFRPEVLIKL